MLLSIIIPARNESSRIAAQIRYLQSLDRSENTPIEIIVCDGESSDKTAQIARENGAIVLETSANRGLQQNAGAQQNSQRARGGVLWFLHADARPHPQSIRYLENISRHKNISGGNFRLRFDASTPATRAFALIAKMQRARGVYYGDSGIWAKREVFDLMNGFRDWPLFEDYDFARRLEKFSRRHGMRSEYSTLPITVSSRRLEKQAGKVLRQWLMLQILFSCGASPEKLARLYYRK